MANSDMTNHHGYTDYPFYDQQHDGLLSGPFCPQFR